MDSLRPRPEPLTANGFARGLCLALVFSSIALLYVSRLGRSPTNLSIDEVGDAYHALTFARTGRSTHGERLPMYFGGPAEDTGLGDPGRDPLFIYIRAGVLKVAPFSEAALRLPSAIVGVIDTLLLFLIARRLFASERLALVAAVLLALAPAHFFQSRIASPQIGVVAFVLTWLLCLMRFLETRRARDLFVATAVLGIVTYVYIAAYIVAPVYLGLTLIVIMMERRSGDAGTSTGTIRLASLAIGGFALAMMPAVAWNLWHPSRIPGLVDYYTHNGYNADLSTASVAGLLVGRLDTWWNAFGPDKLFLTGDASLRFSTRQVGYVLLALAILIPAGLFQLKRIGRPELRFLVLAGFALGPLPAVAVRDFEIKRWLTFVPFAILIATAAVGAAFEHPRRLWRMGVIVLMLLGGLEFSGFLRFYWGPYREYSSFYFGRNLRGAIDEVLSATTEPKCALLDNRVQYLAPYWDLYSLARGRQDFVGQASVVDVEMSDFSAPPACTNASLLVYDDEVMTNEAVRRRLDIQGWRRVPIPESDGAVYLSVYHHVAVKHS